jgi:hypothetical protein
LLSVIMDNRLARTFYERRDDICILI